MFEPPEEIDPAPPQFPPAVLLATMVLVMVTSAGDQMPPPRFAELKAIVTFFSVADWLLEIAPPSVTAVFPLSVTLVRLSVSSFWMPPPSALELLPLIVTRVSVAVPVL